jgi:hypothetical protein
MLERETMAQEGVPDVVALLLEAGDALRAIEHSRAGVNPIGES